MIKFIVPFVFSGFLLFGSTTSALDLNTISPGVTPDQRLYSIDQLLEEFKLFLTTNRMKETEILFELAKERLAEAEAISKEEKQVLINNLVTNYIVLLALAKEYMGELVKEDKMDDTTLSEFETIVEDIILLSKEFEGYLKEDKLEEMKNQHVSLRKFFAEESGQ